MPTGQRHVVRTDISELKSQIEKKIGRVKTETYLNLLSKFLSLKISKCDFDKLIIATVKKENISLHNALLRGIIKNVCLSNTSPLIKKKQLSLGFESLCKDLPKSPRKGRTQVRRFKDCTNGSSKGKSQITDVVVVSSKQWSMEDDDGEEVDQLIRCWKSQPIEAPFGVNVVKKQAKIGTCYSSGELPDSVSLKKKLEDDSSIMEEGLEVSEGFVNSLNAGLDVFLKRLIKPCLELTALRSSRRRSVSSMVDFQVAMESNPSLLGENWPAKHEKIRLGTPHLPADFQTS